MTPLQYAKEECSNYQSDGSCLGVGIRADLSLYSFGRQPKCVLSAKERCQFFEECVLPRMQDQSTLAGQQRSKEHAEARHLYAKDHEKQPIAKSARGQRFCSQCGKRPVEPPQRKCYVCVETNQTKANRKLGRKGGSMTESPT